MSEEKDPFKFDDFSDIIQPKSKMATKKEIDELLTFLGGFEKWPVLIEDCRREVVKYLDYISRFNLGICSKNDHDTVEKTKIRVESVEILDNVRLHYQTNRRRQYNNVTVRIQFPTGSPIEWVFSQFEQDTSVQWVHHIRGQHPVVEEVIWESSNYYEAAAKFAEKWMKKSNFELNAIKVEMKEYPFATSQIKTLPCCKNVRIRADDVDSFEWWLKKCSEQLDDLQLTVRSESFTLPSNFLNAPQIMQASRISFCCRVAFSDEQLLKLKAKSIWFESVDVTDRGINKFIKNWVYGKAGVDFKDLHLWSTSVQDPDVMVAGLEYVEWDAAFENEQRGFVEDFKQYRESGRRYQIKSKTDPFESLTLSIHEDCILILATGKKVEKNGEASTYYRLP